MAHYDASEHLHCYNPDTGHWAPLAELPQGAGVEYAAITGDMETFYCDYSHYQYIVQVTSPRCMWWEAAAETAAV